MNKNAMVPSMMLAVVVVASLTLPVTVSANDTPYWRGRTEHGQPKSGWEGKPIQKPGRHHYDKHHGDEHHPGHGVYGYRGRDHFHPYAHERYKSHPFIHYYEIPRPHRHDWSDGLGRLRLIFDYDLLK